MRSLLFIGLAAAATAAAATTRLSAAETYELVAAAQDLRRTTDVPGSGALQLLTTASTAGSGPPKAEALFLLADAYAHGDPYLALARNLTESRALHERSAALGHAASQAHVGALAGADGDEAEAVLHEYFAATSGDVSAAMALGNRHLHGVGVVASCDEALLWYEFAANEAVHRIAEQYGGASVLPPNERAKLAEADATALKTASADRQIVQYYEHTAEGGDVGALVALGHMYFHGTRGVAQDMSKAAARFQEAADLGDPSAAGSIGHMYAHGIAVAQSNETALTYFRQGEALNDPVSLNGLGVMHLRGMGVEADADRGIALIKRAAEKGYMEALYNLGMLHMGWSHGHHHHQRPQERQERDAHRDPGKALQYLSLAAQNGHVLALHKLGHVYANGLDVMPSCQTAAHAFKTVAERGPWVQNLAQAHALWQAGDDDGARLGYIRAAATGYEAAQSNAAWLEERARCGGDGGGSGGDTDNASSPCMRRALRFYMHASKQGNAEASLRVGDYYYYGLGGLPADPARAVQHYSTAAALRLPQAMFNLGWMYQMGDGVQADFHLAKRHYDAAVAVSAAAAWPVRMAYVWLGAHWAAATARDKHGVDLLGVGFGGGGGGGSGLAVGRPGLDALDVDVDVCVLCGLTMALAAVMWQLGARRRARSGEGRD